MELGILEVLNGSDAQDLMCMLTNEVGVNRINFDTSHLHQRGTDGKTGKMLTGILGESITCSGVG